MPKLVARILLALLVIPGTVFVWVVTFMMTDARPIDTDHCAVIASLASCLFTAVYWTAVWRRDVRWTPAKVLASVLSVVGAGLLGIVLMALLGPITYGFQAIQVATLGAQSAWLVATILLWRDTTPRPAAKADEIVCPACGYNLAGLTEIRCPECGARFTVDDLFARQPGRRTATEANEIGR